MLPGGDRLLVAVADEAGKVDLNTAPVALLARLFAGLTGDAAQGGRIAAEIAAFREPSHDPADGTILERYAADGKREGPKHAPFVTTFELDQVAGVSHALFRAVLPFVTVRARRGDVDVGRATPALLRLLGVKPGAPTSGVLQGGQRSLTITSDATTPEGARFVREALVSIGAGEGEPYVIHEWRRGDVGLDDAGAVDSAPCFALAP